MFTSQVILMLSIVFLGLLIYIWPYDYLTWFDFQSSLDDRPLTTALDFGLSSLPKLLFPDYLAIYWRFDSSLFLFHVNQELVVSFQVIRKAGFTLGVKVFS